MRACAIMIDSWFSTLTRATMWKLRMIGLPVEVCIICEKWKIENHNREKTHMCHEDVALAEDCRQIVHVERAAVERGAVVGVNLKIRVGSDEDSRADR